MPETRTVRRNASLDRLRRLYAHKPIVTHATAEKTAAATEVAPIISPAVRRYLRADITRTVTAVAAFLLLFLALYLLQNTPAIQSAIGWVGSKTGF